ncbi:hypothetical protein SERLA73DRAFT_177809 [Serpula lacrymans var. lacrymans S7.3]|uniref:Uncharacterized protein n=1 Tax=Serpula lacrymans var. lacrymans (strain S7.3) TaxID=936435 RepID=F8PPM0_SERL3|nr:hypothetical protein SERLA73DRAFT_177809 [Serpula lacrymans var. lacrymans S7.3]
MRLQNTQAQGVKTFRHRSNSHPDLSAVARRRYDNIRWDWDRYIFHMTADCKRPRIVRIGKHPLGATHLLDVNLLYRCLSMF